MQLRPYQLQAVEACEEHLVSHGATMFVLPTGGGKTVVAAEIIRRALPRGRAMLIAHREELLEQARDKIALVIGERPDLEMADSRAGTGMFAARVVCSSVQTQTAGRNGQRRMHRFRPADFGLLVVDECHHVPAVSYREVIDHYRSNSALRLLGMTATPDRADEKALGLVYETVAFNYELVDAINEGWLVPIKQKYLDVQIDLSGVKIVLGDLQGAALREVLARADTIERIVSDAVHWAGDRRTLVFADSVENAERMVVDFNRWRAGSAYIVTGETPKDERHRVIADYRAGRFQYLVNVQVAGEGFDVPEIACVVMARPTCSRALYAQAAGRGTRPLSATVDGLDSDAARRSAIASSTKQDLLLLDLVGNSAKHKLITAADMLGGNYDDAVVMGAERTMRESGGAVDVSEVLAKAQAAHNAELLAIAAQKEKLALRGRSRGRDVDPFGVLGIAPHAARGWDHDTPPTAEQRAKLEKWGFDRIDQQTATTAAQLIDEFRRRCRSNLATYRQSKVLMSRWGMSAEEARRTSFTEAGRLIGVLAANNWRRPKGIAYAY